MHQVVQQEGSYRHQSCMLLHHQQMNETMRNMPVQPQGKTDKLLMFKAESVVVVQRSCAKASEPRRPMELSGDEPAV